MSRCEIQIAYAIGVLEPVSISVRIHREHLQRLGRASTMMRRGSSDIGNEIRRSVRNYLRGGVTVADSRFSDLGVGVFDERRQQAMTEVLVAGCVAAHHGIKMRSAALGQPRLEARVAAGRVMHEPRHVCFEVLQRLG